MQQTKQTERACAGGEAPRHGAAARQVDAAVRPSTGVPRPSDAVSARAATSAVVLSRTVQAKQLVAAEKPACRLVAVAHHPLSLVCRLVVLPPSWSIRPGRLRVVRSTTGR